jgi:hypothetical protein
MVSDFLILPLTEHLEERLVRLSGTNVYSFSTLLKIEVFASILTLIPLFNRLKQRYPCSAIQVGRTNPSLLNGQYSHWVALQSEPRGPVAVPLDFVDATGFAQL